MQQKSFKNELHLQSTLGELKLIEARVDINAKIHYIRNLFENNLALPGIIIQNNKKLNGFLTRKAFYECLSKPFGLELFSKGSVGFLLEDLNLDNPIILPASMLIVDAVGEYLDRSKTSFDDSIIVELENENTMALDAYQLILAHSQINAIAMQKLKEANELKTEMLNIAAHDLKNPLSSIICLARMMKEDTNVNEEIYLDTFTQIESISSHMFELIMDLLNSTVIESGRIQPKKQYFDLDELVSALVYQNSPIAVKKEQSIHYTVDRSVQYGVMGDSLKLRESLENLISNAIKYSPFGADIRIELIKTDSKMQFKVIDQGPGLTEEDKEKLFGKFQRLSAQPTNGESSTGLGLFIAKQIVELHNGRIWVESRPGYGSTFIIELGSYDFFDDINDCSN